MKRWLLLLGGLLIWAGHFLGVYLISSAADVWSTTNASGPRLLGAAFSFACLAAALGVAAVVWCRGKTSVAEAEAWEGQVGLAGALVAAISIIWQAAPLAFW